ncbi:hypothetical protein [Bordetella trematum]|uniref:hypothetical protein n=1 Tax=Bordetella trematum TaxID=123899 RepID=UPI00047081EB|nr:hypothetical protein [Bordetella trematum]
MKQARESSHDSIALGQTNPLDIVPTEIIYADKVISGGFGVQVSRIQLGMERSDGKVAPGPCIILPTASVVSLILNAIPALKEGQMLKELRNFAASIEAQINMVDVKDPQAR